MSVSMENFSFLNPMGPPATFGIYNAMKRNRPESPSEVADASNENGAERKRRRNAVSDVLVRQQLLSSLVKAKMEGASKTDCQLFKHVDECSSSNCFLEECSLAKKCLAHFSKCQKEECIVCVEARLNQVVETNTECTEEDRFNFSAWRARLQSVNDETKEYVPYFNSCAKELLIARSTRSPFLQAAKERLLAAQALVSQSEKRYAQLCKEIYKQWSMIIPRESGSTSRTESLSGEENSVADDSSMNSAKGQAEIGSWQHAENDKALRSVILQKIFDWSKSTNPNSMLLGERILMDGAIKAESLLYSVSRSRKEYEDEAERMCQGR